MEKVREYALNNYPQRFIKTQVFRDARGFVTKREKTNIEPIITEFESFYYVQNHKDASGIILSKSVGDES